MLGMLFVNTFLAFLGFCLLALGFPNAALGAGVCFVGGLGVMLVRFVRIHLQSRAARTPVGPLSPDEKLKARSKLLKPRTQN